MPKHIVIVGGGIAGLAAAYELRKLQKGGAEISFTLLEASPRLGGIVDTTCRDGFVLEGGPDGWVSEKPWARELAMELGLEHDLIHSNDRERVTYILRGGRLLPMPDGMRMMVPTDLDALENNPLFSDEARRLYREEPARAAELKANAPLEDESVASFVERHFGAEVLHVIGAPLLNGVFGGDVHKLSVQTVMQPFVQMEREHGSLIVALQERVRERGKRESQPIFTSLRNGVGSLADALAARLAGCDIRRNHRATAISRVDGAWQVAFEAEALNASQMAAPLRTCNAVLLCTPVATTRALLLPLDAEVGSLLEISGSSAVTVAFAFGPGQPMRWPRGFGFLAPEDEGSHLLAATFADQKFPDRAPEGGHSVRAYFGGATADALLCQTDEAITALARRELEVILGALPDPLHTMVSRWPLALPQYHVGHVKRMAELDRRVSMLGGVHLLGNGYRGVGLPDLIRDARASARLVAH